MSTFDDILPHVVRVLNARRAEVEPLAWLLINRDLNGRVRLIAPDALSMAERERLTALYRDLAAAIAPMLFQRRRAFSMSQAPIWPVRESPPIRWRVL